MEQRLDEVHGEAGDPVEDVLRVVHVDLGDVQERLLLVLALEGGLARQHHVRQHPDAPTRHKERRFFTCRCWCSTLYLVTYSGSCGKCVTQTYSKMISSDSDGEIFIEMPCHASGVIR